MGTTLTGTTPQDTYDSLIKVTNNGPLSSTARYLSDGLGNDSVLALSTAAVGVGTTSPNIGTWNRALTLNTASGNTAYELAVGGAAQLYLAVDSSNAYLQVANATSPLRIFTGAAERMRITSAGNVGIGTSSPVARLDAVAAETGTYTTSTQQVVARIYNSPSDLGSGVNSAFLSIQTTPDAGNANPVARIGVVGESYGSNNGSFVVATRDGSGVIEKMRITSDGYLRLAAGGIQFNGDTAAANALDDYEEGTFTATLKGSSSDPSTPVTTTANYTKIGRQVTISIMFANVNTTGASGSVTVLGVPFSCVTAGVGSAITENFTFGATRTTVSSLIDSAAATTIRFIVSGNDTSFENLSHNAGTGRYLYTSFTYFV